MKSFTDIEQSKTLAKILPIESADMRYGYIAPYDYSDRMYDGGYDEIPYPKDFLIKNPNFSANEYDAELPCWSLTALLELIQDDIKIEKTLFDQSDLFTYSITSDTFEYKTYEHEELIDACVEMIVKLNEKGIL